MNTIPLKGGPLDGTDYPIRRPNGQPPARMWPAETCYHTGRHGEYVLSADKKWMYWEPGNCDTSNKRLLRLMGRTE